MNAPPFPLNPTVGERHGSWVWNGARWVCAPTTGIQVITQVFNLSGPYMPSPGLVSCVVECIGGGGGGGSAGPTDATWILEGGGGGSGGYSRITLPAALVLGGVQVTIGAGGTSDPTPGQTTSFGALCVAYGGQSGGNNNFIPDQNDSGQPGPGAPPGIGEWAPGGASGNAGNMSQPGGTLGYSVISGGLGGQIKGGNVAGNCGTGFVDSPPPAEQGTGAGGSGACINRVATSSIVNGGAGGAGVCIVTEYCWASATDGEDCWNPPVNVNARVAVTHVPWTGPGPCPPGWGQGPYIESDE